MQPFTQDEKIQIIVRLKKLCMQKSESTDSTVNKVSFDHNTTSEIDNYTRRTTLANVSFRMMGENNSN